MAMNRTQISLTEAQRQFLERVARREGRSMSDVLRSLVDREMTARQREDDPLLEIVGMVDSESAVTCEDVDRIVYRKDW
jgi:hypothetical protein